MSTPALLTWRELHREQQRMRWAVRHETGSISPVATRQVAETLLADPVWRAMQILHRPTPEDDWTVISDGRGMTQLVEWSRVRVGDHVLVDNQWHALTVDAIVRAGGTMHDESRRVIEVRLPNGSVTGSELHDPVLLRRRHERPEGIR